MEVSQLVEELQAEKDRCTDGGVTQDRANEKRSDGVSQVASDADISMECRGRGAILYGDCH